MFLGPEGRKQIQALGSVGNVGIELAVSICVGYFGGGWLDDKLGTEPWLRWVGLGFGIAAGFRSLYRLARKYQDQLDRDKSEEESP